MTTATRTRRTSGLSAEQRRARQDELLTTLADGVLELTTFTGMAPVPAGDGHPAHLFAVQPAADPGAAPGRDNRGRLPGVAVPRDGRYAAARRASAFSATRQRQACKRSPTEPDTPTRRPRPERSSRSARCSTSAIPTVRTSPCPPTSGTPEIASGDERAGLRTDLRLADPSRNGRCSAWRSADRLADTPITPKAVRSRSRARRHQRRPGAAARGRPRGPARPGQRIHHHRAIRGQPNPPRYRRNPGRRRRLRSGGPAGYGHRTGIHRVRRRLGSRRGGHRPTPKRSPPRFEGPRPPSSTPSTPSPRRSAWTTDSATRGSAPSATEQGRDPGRRPTATSAAHGSAPPVTHHGEHTVSPEAPAATGRGARWGRGVFGALAYRCNIGRDTPEDRVMLTPNTNSRVRLVVSPCSESWPVRRRGGSLCPVRARLLRHRRRRARLLDCRRGRRSSRSRRCCPS